MEEKCMCQGQTTQPVKSLAFDSFDRYQNVSRPNHPILSKAWLLTHFHAKDPCPNEIETSYGPERPEIVYCEKCYQAEVV